MDTVNDGVSPVYTTSHMPPGTSCSTVYTVTGAPPSRKAPPRARRMDPPLGLQDGTSAFTLSHCAVLDAREGDGTSVGTVGAVVLVEASEDRSLAPSALRATTWYT